MCNVMIVEDEPMEREALRRIISQEYKGLIDLIQEAKDGAEAIRLAKVVRPNIIIMDIGLPEVDGLQVQEEIISFLPNVKTIFLTAYSDFSYAQKAIKLRAMDFLSKPVRTIELKASIDRALDALKTDDSLSDILNISGVESSLIDRAIDYMENNFKEKIDLNFISEKFHINPQYFSRLFKKEVGINYIDYLNALRVNHACQLLSNTNYPAYRVSIESGFSDPSYFSRVFNKYTKITPLEYRRRLDSVNYKKSV